MNPLDDFKSEPDKQTKSIHLLEQLSVFVLPVFGILAAFLSPILMALIIAFLGALLGLILN